MHAMVVMAAEQDAVGEVGVATMPPRMEVVGLTPGGRDVAALGAARLVADGHREALLRVEH